MHFKILSIIPTVKIVKLIKYLYTHTHLKDNILRCTFYLFAYNHK